MDALQIWMFIFAGFIAERILEYRQHAQAYRLLKNYPHEEFDFLPKKIFYSYHLIIVPLILLEYFFVQPQTNLILQSLAVLLMCFGVFLRLWVISSLNWLWCMKTIFVKGLKRPDSGPFRYIASPEYFSSFLQGMGLCLFLGTIYSTTFFGIAMAFLIYKITNFEKRIAEEYESFAKVY